RPCAFADRLEMFLDALPERSDRLLDDSAALLLFLHRNSFALCIAPLGDVLVRRDPSAIDHGPIDDRDRSSGCRLNFRTGRLARGHVADQVASVCNRVVSETAVANSVLEQIF